MIIIDIGAHDGSAFALPFAQNENNIVYAIEPIPELADTIRAHKKKNLLVFCMALSDSDGEQEFYVNRDRQTSSLLESKSTSDWEDYAGQLVTEATITVPVSRLDKFLEEQSIEEVDLLKIDTQGNDFSVIKGGGDSISRVKRIILEVQLSPLYKGAASKEQVISYLESKGFHCVSATPQTSGLEENLEFVRINRYPLSDQWSQRLDVNLPRVGTLQMPPQDHVGKLLEQGVFEGPEQAFLWLYLHKGDSFLDCGAHVGLFSCIAAQAMESTGQIISIEPNPLCFAFLTSNLESCSDGIAADVFNFGLSQENGYAEFFLGVSGMSAFSSFAAPKADSTISHQATVVEQRSLDDVFQTLNFEGQITLAKLDVEGWETAVINGANRLISEGRLPIWMVEFTEENARSAGSSTRELRTHFESLGYFICHFNLENLRLEIEPERPSYAYKNLYAVRDLESANSRLEKADSARVDIAKDIIQRWDHAVEAARLQFDLNQQKKELLARIIELQGRVQQTQNAKEQALVQLGHSERQEKQRLEAHHAQDVNRLQGEINYLRDEISLANCNHLELQEKLHALDVNRASIIDQLHRERAQLSAYNTHLIQKVGERKNNIRTLERQLQNAVEQAEHLDAEVARLQVGREAFKEVLKSLLRRLGLFAAVKNMVKGREASAESAHETGSADADKATTAKRPTPEAQLTAAQDSNSIDEPRSITPDQAIQSDLADVVVIARSLGVDVAQDPDALDFVGNLISTPASVLCVEPDRPIIPLLQRLVSSKRPIVCISNAIASELASHHIAAHSSLANWLVSLEQPLSSQCELLYLTAAANATDQKLLQGRLAPNTQILVKDSNSDGDGQRATSLSACKDLEPVHHVGSLRYYSAPPARWIDPLYQAEPMAQGQRWPWNYNLPRLPDVMPSGRPWPKISVVTVSFNHGQFVEETIRSVLGQNYPNLEYIVVDGGSTDETPSILSRYKDELSYWISEPDNGQSNALNKGFRRATGDILAWLNSDDRYLPHTLARVAIAFDTYQSDMVVGGCQMIQDYRTSPFQTHRSRFPIGQVVPLPLKNLLDIDNCWHKGDFFYQPEVFWTRDLWQKSGGQLDESLFYSMDYDLWARMAQEHATLVHVPDALALYRVHSDQKTFGDDVPYLPELKGVSDRYKARLTDMTHGS